MALIFFKIKSIVAHLVRRGHDVVGSGGVGVGEGERKDEGTVVLLPPSFSTHSQARQFPNWKNKKLNFNSCFIKRWLKRIKRKGVYIVQERKKCLAFICRWVWKSYGDQDSFFCPIRNNNSDPDPDSTTGKYGKLCQEVCQEHKKFIHNDCFFLQFLKVIDFY